MFMLSYKNCSTVKIVGALLVAACLGLGLRFMLRVDTATAQPKPFVHEIALAHPVATVWAALTHKALVDKYYFAPVGADISQAGTEIYYGLPDGKLITGTILKIQPPALLVHTFRFVGDETSPETTVTYSLAANGIDTTLRVEHRGYPVPSQGYADISGGWPIIFDRLAALLDGHPEAGK